MSLPHPTLPLTLPPPPPKQKQNKEKNIKEMLYKINNTDFNILLDLPTIMAYTHYEKKRNIEVVNNFICNI